MYLKNCLSAFDVRIADKHLPVETTWTHKCRVKNVRAVCGSYHNNAFVYAKAVQFNKKLVKCLLALVVSATKSCSPLATYRVDFIYKDNTRFVFLCLVKQISYTRSTNTDKHFHKIRA